MGKLKRRMVGVGWGVEPGVEHGEMRFEGRGIFSGVEILTGGVVKWFEG